VVGKFVRALHIIAAGAAVVAAPVSALELQGRNTFIDPDGTNAPSFNTITGFSPSDNAIVIPRGEDGYYHVDLRVNGVTSGFIVDTGSNYVTISEGVARRLGIDTAALDFNIAAQSPSGEITAAITSVASIRLYGREEKDVEAVILKSDMPTSLLGMSYLSRFSNISISGSNMVLTP